MAAEESIFFKPTPWQTDIQAESLSKALVSVGIVVEARGEALQGENAASQGGLTAPGSFLHSLVLPCSQEKSQHKNPQWEVPQTCWLKAMQIYCPFIFYV